MLTALQCKKYNNEIERSSPGFIGGYNRRGEKTRVIRDVDSYVAAYAGLKLFHAFSFMKSIEFDKEKEEQGYYTEVLVDFIMNGLAR